MSERTWVEIVEDENENMTVKYPNFTITCKCGSTRIAQENTLGYSDTSGSWGDISLVCLDCKNEVVIFEDMG